MKMDKQSARPVGSNMDERINESSFGEWAFTEDGLLDTTAASPIVEPDAAYLASTTKIDISGLPFDSVHNSISDGVLSVTFSTPMQKF